jgi:hypothetical protein
MPITNGLPRIPANQVDIIPENRIHVPPPMPVVVSTGTIIDWVTDELRRLRYELQQTIITLHEINPSYVCANLNCVTLQHGRVTPHIRNMACEGK